MPVIFANILQPLIDVTEAIMVFFHDHVFGSWGLSIIALTVVVRAALIPLTLKQFRGMQNLQRHLPEMKALQEKYKGDKQRLNQEMMKFYQENNVNPLASCLPLAAQIPIFISLFYMLRHDLKLDICGPASRILAHAHGSTIANTACEKVEPGSANFLFIPDLTGKATGAVLVVLLVLYVGSMLASSLLMTVTADRTQRQMMIMLPLVFSVFVVTFPTGLTVYWITTNLWTIVQQYIVRRRVGPLKPVAATGGGDGRVAPSAARAATPARAAPPPPPPRKKKKQRSGRRR